MPKKETQNTQTETPGSYNPAPNTCSLKVFVLAAPDALMLDFNQQMYPYFDVLQIMWIQEAASLCMVETVPASHLYFDRYVTSINLMDE